MNNIKAIRNLRGLSQKDLARAVGTNFQQIQKLEKAERRLTQEWMERLAAALRCSPADIINPRLDPAALDESPKSRGDGFRETGGGFKGTPTRDPLLDHIMTAVYSTWYSYPRRDEIEIGKLTQIVHAIYISLRGHKKPPQAQLKKRVEDMLNGALIAGR